ncbi:MAG: hypothetical protein U0794_04705 [Isosphaeraceae bacterium]
MMAKYSAVLGNEIGTTRRPVSSPRGMILSVLLVASLPFLYEWAMTVYARWQAMLGTHVAVKTPIWDWVSDHWFSIREAIRYQSPTMFSINGTSPSVVMGALVALAVFGVLFLRRGT